MNKCINDYDQISSIINSYSISTKNSLEIALEKKDKKMIEIILGSYNKNDSQNLILKQRCIIEPPKIQIVNTGENSQYMIGVKTRKLNQTRGNKMGNDAFIRDDKINNENNIASEISKFLMENCDEPSFLDYIKTLQYKWNYNNILNVNYESYIIDAVLKGNIQTARHILKGLETNYNFGFNTLHYQVLEEGNVDNINIKVKTSITKKPQTNNGMTPMHDANINPDVNYLKKLVELGGDWNILDDLNRKPIHYAACCKEEGPINYFNFTRSHNR